MNTKQRSTAQQKIDWLKAHQKLWEGVPTCEGDVYASDHWDSVITELFVLMQSDGLYSLKTYVKDGRYSVLGHIRLLRSQRCQRCHP